MAVLANTQNPTLADWKAALDPMGGVGDLINLLEQTNDIVSDATFIEGNEATGHLMNIATGLPATSMRRLYEGIVPSKGARQQVREHVGWLEAFHEIDERLVALDGNGPAFRLQEAMLQVESMQQEFTRQLFYGNHTTDPKEVNGLAQRYSSTTGNIGINVIDADSSASTSNHLQSIWLINWGPSAIFCFTPKGIPSGLKMEDLGKETSTNYGGVTGALLRVWRMHFQWDFGLAVADWRYAVRIGNIDLKRTTDSLTSGANLPKVMADAIRKTPRRKLNRPAFYMGNRVWGKLEQQLSEAVKESTLTREMVGGVMTTSFQGIPLRQVDILDKSDEAKIS